MQLCPVGAEAYPLIVAFRRDGPRLSRQVYVVFQYCCIFKHSIHRKATSHTESLSGVFFIIDINKIVLF